MRPAIGARSRHHRLQIGLPAWRRRPAWRVAHHWVEGVTARRWGHKRRFTTRRVAPRSPVTGVRWRGLGGVGSAGAWVAGAGWSGAEARVAAACVAARRGSAAWCRRDEARAAAASLGVVIHRWNSDGFFLDGGGPGYRRYHRIRRAKSTSSAAFSLMASRSIHSRPALPDVEDSLLSGDASIAVRT